MPSAKKRKRTGGGKAAVSKKRFSNGRAKVNGKAKVDDVEEPPLFEDETVDDATNIAADDTELAESDAEDDASEEEADEQQSFSADKLRRMFAYMLDASEDRAEFIVRFGEHVDKEDVRRGGLPALAAAVAALKHPPSETLSLNLFNVLRRLRLKSKRLGDRSREDVAVRRSFDELWLRLLRWPLSPALYRRVLTLLPDRVLPHLENPLRLTDFLLTSYQLGGVVSILSLHGVFYLMQHHNLEYPQFYDKLYTLLTPAAVRSPQRAKFFRLLDLFLGSGYLPEYLVAAFVKRLSRLTLTAPAPTQTLLIRLACNLMVRHRGLQRLTDDPRGPTALPADPYDPAAGDPARSGAGQSSLWEIQTMKQHLVPAVARAAGFVDREIPQMEHPLLELLEADYDQLIQAELDRKLCTDVALTFHKPEGILSWKEDQLSANWKLQ